MEVRGRFSGSASRREGDPPSPSQRAPDPPSPSQRAPAPPIRPPGRARRRLLKALIALLLLYLTPPLLLYHSTWCQDAIIFVHYLRTPFFANLSDPLSFNLTSVREFELVQEDGCVVSAWQVLPRHYHHKSDLLDGRGYDSSLSDGHPIIVYMHGNTGTRATQHRVDLYKFVSEDLGYHVITFDYRGYGDSPCHPSERGMMEDGRLVWEWVRSKAPGARVFIWGHSLGSAATTYLAKELCSGGVGSRSISGGGDPPSGVILDAPFPDITLAAENHPFSLPYRPIMPLFSYFILQGFKQKFESAQRLEHISSPILILHGQEDFVVPFHLGEKFHKAAQESREKDPSLGKVEFVDCGGTGHKNNYKSPKVREAVKQFVEQ